MAPVERARLAVVLLAAFACSLGACGKPTASGADGGEFLAFDDDFAGFMSWDSVTIENAAVGGATHVVGRRTVYINERPPVGATEFPVGTVIVKVTDTDGKVFARAKRGPTFNAKGAHGWEWFELVKLAAGGYTIKWRGVGPPLGEVYGGDPNAGCNACHKIAVANDSVLTPGFSLAPTDAIDSGTQEGGNDASAD